MPTFTLVISDEPFAHDDPGAAPFVETIEHGAGGAPTPATEVFRRCLDVIASRPVNAAAFDRDRGNDTGDAEAVGSGDYSLRDDLDSIAEALVDGVELLDQIVAGQHRTDFALEGDDRAEQLRANALDAAADLRQALKTFREVADWPEPGEDGA